MVDLTSLKTSVEELKSVAGQAPAAGGPSQADVDELNSEIQAVIAELRGSSSPASPPPVASGPVTASSAPAEPPSVTEPPSGPQSEPQGPPTPPWQQGR